MWLWKTPFILFNLAITVSIDGFRVFGGGGWGVGVILIRFTYNDCWIERWEISLVMFPQELVTPSRCYWKILNGFRCYLLLLLTSFYALNFDGQECDTSIILNIHGSFLQPCQFSFSCISFGWPSFIKTPIGLWLKRMLMQLFHFWHDLDVLIFLWHIYSMTYCLGMILMS